MASSRPEPEWDDAEQTAILAYQLYRESLCPLCGGPISICTNAENEHRFRGGLPIRCHATTARLVAMEPYKEQPYNQALMIAPQLRD